MDKSWLSRCRGVRGVLAIFVLSNPSQSLRSLPLASLPPSTSALKISPASALSSSLWRASRWDEMGARTHLWGDALSRSIHKSRGGGQLGGRDVGGEKTRMDSASFNFVFVHCEQQ